MTKQENISILRRVKFSYCVFFLFLLSSCAIIAGTQDPESNHNALMLYFILVISLQNSGKFHRPAVQSRVLVDEGRLQAEQGEGVVLSNCFLNESKYWTVFKLPRMDSFLALDSSWLGYTANIYSAKNLKFRKIPVIKHKKFQ